MRDIRFRAWVRFLRVIRVVDQLNSNGSAMIEDYKYCIESEAFDLMQFTGLKDRNGVEIYCGDIISDHNGLGVVKYSENHGAFRVVYSDGVAKWFIDYTLNGERESIEVIGNIYENPELIGG